MENCPSDNVLISRGGDLRGVVDGRLAAMGRGRRIVLGLPAFLPALAAAAASGGLVTLPARLARVFAGGFGLVTAKPPVEIGSFPVSVFWYRRNYADPRTSWMRQQVKLSVSAQRVEA
jgi:DNA-binding transcriptional LysR family regulator